MQWYIKVWKDGITFSGRSRRKEYWMFVLFNTLMCFALGLAVGLIKGFAKIDLTIIPNLYIIATIIPLFAVVIRRAHDCDYKGWWILVPIFNIALLFIDGDAKPNRFGPDPKAAERSATPAA